MPFFLILQTFIRFSSFALQRLRIFALSICTNKQKIMTSLFDKGKAHYERQAYDDAVRSFAQGSAEQLYNLCRMWSANAANMGWAQRKIWQ